LLSLPAFHDVEIAAVESLPHLDHVRREIQVLLLEAKNLGDPDSPAAGRVAVWEAF